MSIGGDVDVHVTITDGEIGSTGWVGRIDDVRPASGWGPGPTRVRIVGGPLKYQSAAAIVEEAAGTTTIRGTSAFSW